MPSALVDLNALYVGGPLDSKSFTKTDPGPLRRARSIAGQPITTSEAITSLCTEAGGIYLHVEVYVEDERVYRHYYVHSTIIEGWHRWTLTA